MPPRHAAVCLLLAAVTCCGQDRLARFNEYKFGMFIHWGPYSLASVEASWPIMRPDPKRPITEQEYRGLPDRFNPAGFDPKAWVRLARDAGQRYMVITSKHHDGFCMFDSRFTNYKITRTPYKKDILAELAAACRQENMPLGFYYSPPDMNHPGFRDTSRPSSENWQGEPWRPEWSGYLGYMELQLRELLTRYGDVFVIWFDGLGEQEKYDGWRFLQLIRAMQPATLVNNRVGLPADFETPEQFIPKGIPTRKMRIAGVDRSQQASMTATVPAPEDFRPWETCMTINGTWGYNRHDLRFKPVSVLIRTLVEVASKGGNLLLNVGPTPEGRIQPEFEERLRGIGAWLKTNGESIYGSTYGPFQELGWGRSTAKQNMVYLHVFEWPGRTLQLRGVKWPVARATLLAGRVPLKFTQQGELLSLNIPDRAPDPAASVIALETVRK